MRGVQREDFVDGRFAALIPHFFEPAARGRFVIV